MDSFSTIQSLILLYIKSYNRKMNTKIEKPNLTFTDVQIQPKEVLRYLGYKNQEISETLNLIIEETIEETEKIIRPACTFEPVLINWENGEPAINRIRLPGKNIAAHLADCTQGAVLAATVGLETERRMRTYQVMDMTRAVIMDACASAAIEEVCDIVSSRFDTLCEAQSLFATERFSPGYGDLPLTLQPALIALTDAAKRIGLTCSRDNLLFPRKSVTAIIGVRETPRPKRSKRCDYCSLREKCKFGICEREQ